MRKWALWAARLYPADWRLRYGAEFDALLEDAGPRWSDLANIIRGAAIMQTKQFMGYGKIAVLSGIVGALVAGGIAFALNNQYVSDATLMAEGPNNGALQSVIQSVGSRDNLFALIHDPILALYRKELAREPIDEVANRMRRNIRIIRMTPSNSTDPLIFKISFRDPDKATAQMVVARLTTQLVNENLRASLLQSSTWPIKGSRLQVLDSPTVPQIPSFPNRLLIVLIGLLGGMLTGLLSLKFWRRNRGYVLLTVDIPQETKQFVDTQIASGRYRQVSDYLRELIQADRQAKAAQSPEN